MNDWKKYRLDEIGEIITGYTPSTKISSYWIGDIPFYSPADINGDLYCETTERTISQKCYLKSRSIKRNSILVTCIGSIGKIALAGKAGVTNQQINSLTCGEKFDSKFTFYNVSHNISKLDSLYGITTIPIVNKKQFGSIELLFPTLNVQRKIATILSTIDGQIEKTEAIIAKYQAVKQGMMQDLLAPKDSEKDKWVEYKLSDVVDLLHGYQFRDSDFVLEGIPVIKISNVKGSSLFLLDLSYVSVDRLKEFESVVIKNGDILMSLTGNIGRVVVVQCQTGPLLQNYRVGKFVPKEKLVEKEFLKYLLSDVRLFDQLSQYSNQSAQANFGKQDLNKLKVTIPKSLLAQKKIAKEISAIDSHLDKLSMEFHKLKFIKSGLLCDLMNGEVELSN